MQCQRRGKIRTVFVTRHGARADNAPDRDSRWLEKVPHNRPGDTPLSPIGHQEADELATEIYKRCNSRYNDNTAIKISIFSSPYIRNLETALAIARSFSSTDNSPIIKVEPGIAEVGSTATNMASEQELLQQGYSFSNWIDQSYRSVMARTDLKPEFGDTAAGRRAKRVAQTIAAQSSDDDVIVFVGHGASCLGLVTAFGAPQNYIGYCSLTEFIQPRNENGEGKWEMVGKFGDVSHLSDPQISLDSAW